MKTALGVSTDVKKEQWKVVISKIENTPARDKIMNSQEETGSRIHKEVD